MKKVIVILTAMVTCIWSTAQSTPQKDPQKTEQTKPAKETYMFKGGKVMEMKGGAWVATDRELTLSNGTKVSASGTVTKKDGTSVMLKEGESIDANGNWMAASKDSKTPGK